MRPPDRTEQPQPGRIRETAAIGTEKEKQPQPGRIRENGRLQADTRGRGIMGKAVIFDNDGVIIDSEPLHIEADLQILAEYGIDWKAADLHRFIGVKDAVMWKALQGELGLPDSPEALKEKKGRIRDAVFTSERIRPIDGIPELFAALKAAGWKVAVATSSQRSLIGPWLEAMGLGILLDALVAGDDVDHAKPHPEPYIRAAALLGVQPSDCTAIEDSPHGVASAKAAGCRCIGFRTPGGPRQDLSEADIIVDSIRSILEGDLLGLGAQ
jgi:HAD superfamily hydrolase (TIGR01509 family)